MPLTATYNKSVVEGFFVGRIGAYLFQRLSLYAL